MGCCGPQGADSEAQRCKRWGKQQDKIRIKETIERDLVIHKIKTFPTDLITFNTTGKQVDKVLPTCGKLLLPPNHLPQDTVASNPKHILKPNINCSTNEGIHLGVWEIMAKKPRLTLESRDQSPEAVEAMDNLLRFITTYIVPKIATVEREYILKLLKHDLKWSVFAVEAKEAGSGIVHLDWNDDRAIYAWGGEFCTPQLGIKFSICPGQVLAVLARVLAYFSALVTSGCQVVMACLC
ncbi:hypothetical protein P692DRAFT_20849794 [Suillus brevipes Sb2]|nr:hypothetical protein P692DRAFT_20849794 [Suillus brevipes Sb2]